MLLYMSKKLKELLERVATWPDAAQEEAQASLEANVGPTDSVIIELREGRACRSPAIEAALMCSVGEHSLTRERARV
jgi:hypothetical protein